MTASAATRELTAPGPYDETDHAAMDPAEPDVWSQSRLNCLWLMVPLEGEELPREQC